MTPATSKSPTPLTDAVSFDLRDIAENGGVAQDEQLVRASEMEKLERANAELRKALEWKPIETAPKDWSNVILANVDDWNESVQGYYDCDAECWRSMSGIETEHNGECYPTHWMPLPNPPETATTESKGVTG